MVAERATMAGKINTVPKVGTETRIPRAAQTEPTVASRVPQGNTTIGARSSIRLAADFALLERYLHQDRSNAEIVQWENSTRDILKNVIEIPNVRMQIASHAQQV